MQKSRSLYAIKGRGSLKIGDSRLRSGLGVVMRGAFWGDPVKKKPRRGFSLAAADPRTSPKLFGIQP